MDKLLDRFFNYVSFDTQAKANVKSVPSTQGQRKLAQALQQELLTLGFSHVTLSDHGCVMATLPAMSPGRSPRLALLPIWTPHQIFQVKC